MSIDMVILTAQLNVIDLQ